MKPVLPTPPTGPAAPASSRLAAGASPAAPSPKPALPLATVPLGVLATLLALGGVLLAASVALLVHPWLGALGSAWAAALGAALGVAVAAVPAGWLLMRLARELTPGTGRVDAGAAPPAGMPRSLFLTLAEREFARARRYGTGAALVLVEVDRYSRLCEARGPGAGDAVLAQMLCLTAPTLRTADVLTQFSPMQVAVFLVHADATGALDVAERIRERSEQMEVLYPASPDGQRLRVTVSTGVAHLRPAHLSLQALVDDAVEALAAARAAGGNCVRAAPVDLAAPGQPGPWRERRAQPRQDGSA
jgi:diguanylate cyclase (GGDEF)-like protein